MNTSNYNITIVAIVDGISSQIHTYVCLWERCVYYYVIYLLSTLLNLLQNLLQNCCYRLTTGLLYRFTTQNLPSYYRYLGSMLVVWIGVVRQVFGTKKCGRVELGLLVHTIHSVRRTMIMRYCRQGPDWPREVTSKKGWLWWDARLKQYQMSTYPSVCSLLKLVG